MVNNFKRVMLILSSMEMELIWECVTSLVPKVIIVMEVLVEDIDRFNRFPQC